MQMGVIGLGAMGLPIAIRLVKQEYCVCGFDVAQGQLEAFSRAGGRPATSLEQLLQESELVFLSLPNNALVDAHLARAVAHCKPGTLVVDLSSASPEIIRSHAAKATAAGISLVDCPLSGGQAGAEAGSLSALCGGEAAEVERLRPYLQAFAAESTHMGPLGCGYIAKMANNMIVGGEIVLLAEALAFSEQAGLDSQLLLQAIQHGAAASAVLDNKGPKMLTRNYEASSRLAIHLKDQHNALALGTQLRAYTPLCALATELMEQMETRGQANQDVAVMAELFREAVSGALSQGSQAEMERRHSHAEL